MTVKCSFDTTKNKPDYFREVEYIERLCKKLIDYAKEIINYNEKEMILLADKENRSSENQKACHICKKSFFCFDENENNKFKLYQKVRDHCHCTGKFREATHRICNLRYKVPKEIPVVIHIGSTYGYHFISTELAKNLKVNFNA